MQTKAIDVEIYVRDIVGVNASIAIDASNPKKTYLEITFPYFGVDKKIGNAGKLVFTGKTPNEVLKNFQSAFGIR